MEFWSGVGNTVLIVGLASCVFVFLMSLAMPELGSRTSGRESARSMPIERWLQAAAVAFTAAVLLEVSSPLLNTNVVGILRVGLTFVGLAIVFSLLNRASLQIQRRFRRSR